ncbi:MAG: dihydrolipoamide acetyltransferase family protein [Pseudomonadota bacterium]|nr:dihydrolipoamide acetyltransferase family protein [Pseudomonadota bacterium]
MSLFNLPDLGEGLPDAEIVEWYVSTGEQVEKDGPLVSVETAKAIVDIPSPRTGTVHKLFGEAGDIVHTGDPLVEFSSAEDEAGTMAPGEDPGTVVGVVRHGDELLREPPAVVVGKGALGVRATPAVRALARRLEVDLGVVTPGGPNGMITTADVQRVSRILREVGPMEPLRGVRRAMARTLAQAHAEVVPVTVTEDADVDAWAGDEDVTLRLIRAIVAACQEEPSLNAWYDSHAVGRRVLDKIDLGIAVDAPEGLFVPVLRDIGNRIAADLRQGLEDIKKDVRSRSIPPDALRGGTFTLSNFGTFGGRYANPVIVPPTVAILGAGRHRDQVVPFQGTPAVHRVLPLSLTFDHRAVTGGEATRFLTHVVRDLETA